MTKEEVWKFLDSKTKIFVAFPMKNGYPHLSPIWFCVLDGKLYLRTHDYKVKAELAASGRACCCIDEGEMYKELRGIIIWGRSRLVREKALIDQISRVMDERYKDLQWKESEMPAYWVSDRMKERRAFIEVTPEKISSWDNRKVSSGLP